MNNAALKVADGMLVSLEYKLRTEETGRVVKRTKEQSPSVFVQGQKQVVAGLEQALYGMAIGEEKNFTVEAAEGYGQISPEAIRTVQRRRISTAVELTPGINLRLRDKQTGQVSQAKVLEVSTDKVLLDFNHRLAGKRLYYHVRIADMRPATPEELAKGQEQTPPENSVESSLPTAPGTEETIE